MKALARFVRLAAVLLALAATGAQAGGPLSICNFAPIKYPGAGTVNLNYDLGNLGSRTKAQADAIVTSAVALWTNVGTATVTIGRGLDLPLDVTSANILSLPYYTNFSDGLNPVIYDTNGSIIDLLLGVGMKNSVLGFAGSAWFGAPTCQYAEGRAVINGFINVTDAALSVVLAHEIGHLIGLDHTQLDSTQGLTQANYPLMYPIAYRSTASLHEDEVAAVSALYPDATLNSIYGQISGTLVLADGATPVRGANLWATETTTNKVYSIVSDYLTQNTGYFKLLMPAGTYNLRAEAIQSGFTDGSSVGPYSELSTDPSFQAPLYVGGVSMATVTLGNATPTSFVINPGCVATLTFRIDGTGSVGGNCSGSVSSFTLTVTKSGTGSGTVTSNPAGIACGAACSASYASGASVSLTATPAAGSTFAGWSSACSGTGTCTVTMNSAISVTATFALADDGFPGGAIPAGWIQPSGSNASWVVANDAAYAGSLSLKSGIIGNSQKSEISYTANLSAGTVSFARKVSSELDFDYLEFYIDGLLQNRWSGEVPWSVVSFPISAGTHTLLWRYVKDAFVSSGGDAAWIDSVTLPSAVVIVTPPSAPTLTSATASYTSATLSFTAPTSTGGSPITGYTATCTAAGKTPGTGTGTSSPILVSGLVGATTYSCTLTASNSAGASAASNALSLTTLALFTPTYRVDIRSYIPAALGGVGYSGFLRVINTSNATTPVSVAVIDGDTGIVGNTGILTNSLPVGAAVTYTATVIEQALGTTIAAASRPRIRVGAQAAVEVQSFMSNPGGVMTQLSGAQSGTSVDVRTYIPWALNSVGYVSFLRIINTGSSATAVTVAVIDGDTGAVGTSGTLNAALPPGAAITYSGQQVEGVLGLALPASVRPRIRVTSTTAVEVQSFMSNPGGVVTETVSVQ